MDGGVPTLVGGLGTGDNGVAGTRWVPAVGCSASGAGRMRVGGPIGTTIIEGTVLSGWWGWRAGASGVPATVGVVETAPKTGLAGAERAARASGEAAGRTVGAGGENDREESEERSPACAGGGVGSGSAAGVAERDAGCAGVGEVGGDAGGESGRRGCEVAGIAKVAVVAGAAVEDGAVVRRVGEECGRGARDRAAATASANGSDGETVARRPMKGGEMWGCWRRAGRRREERCKQMPSGGIPHTPKTSCDKPHFPFHLSPSPPRRGRGGGGMNGVPQTDHFRREHGSRRTVVEIVQGRVDESRVVASLAVVIRICEEGRHATPHAIR